MRALDREQQARFGRVLPGTLEVVLVAIVGRMIQTGRKKKEVRRIVERAIKSATKG